MVTPQDLQKMLDRIEKLARNGAKEAAQELLAQLDNILRNLEPGMAGNMDPPQDSPLSQMLDELTDLMRRQQQLMDDTQKMPGGENGEPSGDPYSGERGQPGNNANKEALAAQQDALRRLLDEMMGRLGEQGMRAPPTFGEAGKSMEGATGSLRQGARDPALEAAALLNLIREEVRANPSSIVPWEKAEQLLKAFPTSDRLFYEKFLERSRLGQRIAMSVRQQAHR